LKRLAVFASGRGSNFQAILAHIQLGVLRNVEAALLITNDANAPAAEIARKQSVPDTFIQGVCGKQFGSQQERDAARNRFDEMALGVLRDRGIDLVALAGFMQVLGPTIVNAFPYRIMNIHPAKDLVRFGGKGMYGERVHAAVIQAGEKESGCTIHYVDNTIDRGPVIIQATVPVYPDDTPEILAHRVLVQEHRTYSKAIQLHVDGHVKVSGGKAKVTADENWEQEWNERQAAYIQHQDQVSQKQQYVLKSTA